MEAHQSENTLLKRHIDEVLYGEEVEFNDLSNLAIEIDNGLDCGTINDDPLHACGSAALQALQDRPDAALQLAHNKIHTYPFHVVPLHWRRLYEEATLRKVVQMLRVEGEKVGRLCKKRKLEDIVKYWEDGNLVDEKFIAEFIRVLDTGVSLSGAPGRKVLIESIFQDHIKDMIGDETFDDIPRRFLTPTPLSALPNPSGNQVERTEIAIDLESFQQHLDTKGTPLIIAMALIHWPASHLWQSPRYFLGKTLGGRRYVPVEVGRSYTDPDWSQQFIPFRGFMTQYVLAKDPPEIGYLAQHDLFAQISSLKADIMIPDYCYASPPAPCAGSAAAKTAGLAGAQALEEPLLNAWLGPKGTRTPLHTDPYHNILCQVVGWKYVRLYPPEETGKLYPCGNDDKGVSMNNTSQIDISAVAPKLLGQDEDTAILERLEALKADFPLFKEAKFVEGILGPGECLYVPLGWWHYVESLSVSVSVSFWFD